MAAATVTTPKDANRALLHAAIVIVAGILATSLAQTQLLAVIPLRNLLKNELHVDRAANAAFFFWLTIPWFLKPIFGIIIDAFPLFGSRRRSYILVTTAATVISWLGIIVTPHRYGPLLFVCLLINTFMMMASTVVGGYMVETAQANSGTGRLSSVRMFVQQGSYIISGPVAGFLASIAFGWTATACASVMFLLIPATIWFLHEQPSHVDSQQLLDSARKQMVKIGHAGTMWAASGLLALFYIAPGLETARFYIQQNDLHMNTEAQGILQMLSGIGCAVAAVVYWFLCRRFNLRQLLVGCLAMGTMANLVFLFYSSPGNAQMCEAFNGFGYTLAELSLLDLATRATPSGSEALGFSLMMSVRNFALYGTDWIGSKMLDKYHLAFSTLVFSNAATTLLTVPLVFLLPLYIVSRKDAE
jgi:predicted MFS family arabinose efflux permease